MLTLADHEIEPTSSMVCCQHKIPIPLQETANRKMQLSKPETYSRL